ncbi:4Fe-4S dicluster domain-containing protein [Halomonas daqiaonensis]|uniref:4Fe-4S binding domain-containing protein n=1 Tax=Halomonas daqiaonensis TaxID=650850 RepID=A0A1H7FF10_9GAMM|nr:4Fe-4S binding protein [Halomonas daqiaonensis]SEK22670.1 4Fe-4S binding domain-containing protein [Halomonas daqiaonensis]
MNQPINIMPVDDDRNRQAREAAHRRVSWPLNLTPASVAYHSQGHALVLGNERDVRRAARALHEHGLPLPTLLFTEPMDSSETGEEDEALLADTAGMTSQRLSRAQARTVDIEGYLGHFTVRMAVEDGPLDLARALTDREHFDLILDLGESPVLALELPPPGYLALAWHDTQRDDQLEALAGLVGEFDKPRYFQIDNALCAHSASGYTGCTRCLDVCPADAVHSHQGRIEAWIEIDPFRCHGVGSCSSACPTGAIQFRLPETARQQETLLAWLAAYREAGGTAPVVRFAEAGDLVGENDAAGHVLDIPLEELGAAGHDQWLTALAGGAAEVRIQYRPGMPGRLTSFIDDQLDQAHALLQALGHSPSRLTRLMSGDMAARDALPGEAPLVGEPLAFTGNDKRDRLDSVLTHLEALGSPDGQRHTLPPGAAYGGLAVDGEACTLCFSCVSNCPTPALATGDDRPLLSFREADCVQCGLCAEACPEDAITLVPGFLADPTRRERQVQHEEAAFPCIRCGKPFATMSTVATLKAKLADHPYFAGDALARLEMCEDCRVKDVWQAMARDPEAQLKV